MEMTAVWKERKSKSPFPLFPHCLGKLAQQPRASHIPTASAAAEFLFALSSFNFNFDEKCYLHARYFLLPTSPVAHHPD